MFKKKTCTNCGKNVSDKYGFCPYCGSANDNLDSGEWGMLGKNDLIPTNNVQLPTGFNMILNSLMKNLSKQLNGMYEKSGKDTGLGVKKERISISISTSGNNCGKS